MRNFSDFLDRQDRQNKNHLEVLMELFKKAGFKVASHLDDRHDPYVYVHKPNEFYPETDNLTFNGIRVYARGKDIIAFRCQNREKTEPFGGSFSLDVKGMYKSLIRDNEDNEQLGKQIAKYLVDEVLNFFLDSSEAAKDDNSEEDAFGKVMITGQGTDYANTVTGKNFGTMR